MSTSPRSPERDAAMHVLVVDDDAAVRAACCEIAHSLGYQPQGADGAAAARRLLRGHRFDMMLLDMKSALDVNSTLDVSGTRAGSPSLAGASGATETGAAGLQSGIISGGMPSGTSGNSAAGGVPGRAAMHAALLDEVKALHPETAILLMTADRSVASAVEAMRTGASDYLTKPFSVEELAVVLERAAGRQAIDLASRQLRERLRTEQGLGNIVGSSREMDRLYRMIAKVALSTHPVLVSGESGTGKELVARAIHDNGPYAGKPFVPVDCSSFVPTLIESELFGYVKGAFTGATRSHEGLLASAEGGTVFLDEIGELPLDLQSKLLRALQEKEIRPVGATHRIPINVRILAATNRDLSAMVEQGRFRKDLYYRLNVANLRLPPLRERREDIPMLAAHFMVRLGSANGIAYRLSDESLRAMMDYDWPGNVRELENALERACAVGSGPLLQVGDMPTQLKAFRLQTMKDLTPEDLVVAGEAAPTAVMPLAEMEKSAILEAIRKLHGDKLLAARLLGIGKTTLYRKLKEYGISEKMIGDRMTGEEILDEEVSAQRAVPG